MAIKLSGSITRKVPIPGVDYSSQSFAAGMEIEINSAEAGEVQAQLAQLYASLSHGIDAQIAAVGAQPELVQRAPAAAVTRSQSTPTSAQAAVSQGNGYASGRNRIPAAASNGNGNGRRITCTEAQAKCIYAICKAHGLDLASVLADFNVADARQLGVKDASRLIDQLKAQNGNGTAA